MSRGVSVRRVRRTQCPWCTAPCQEGPKDPVSLVHSSLPGGSEGPNTRTTPGTHTHVPVPCTHTPLPTYPPSTTRHRTTPNTSTATPAGRAASLGLVRRDVEAGLTKGWSVRPEAEQEVLKPQVLSSVRQRDPRGIPEVPRLALSEVPSPQS